MLDDLKSFFTNSSVAEVGVGVTIGAAFAGLVGAATESVQSLVSGDPDFSGLVRALVVLLSVALISVFGVVKPLLRLKERLGRVQAEKVARVVDQARSGDLAGAAGSAREAGLPVPGGATARAGAADPATAGDTAAGDTADPATAGDTAAGDTAAGGAGAGDTTAGDPATADPATGVAVDPALGTQEAPAVDPVTGEPLAGADPAAGAASVDPVTGEPAPAVDPVTGEPLAAAGAPAAAAASGPAEPGWDPLTGPLPQDAGGGTAAAATAAPAAGAPEGGAPAGSGPATRVPFAQTAVKACPYCAFEIPEVATRCGWCTSDLGDVQRAAEPVLVEG